MPQTCGFLFCCGHLLLWSHVTFLTQLLQQCSRWPPLYVDRFGLGPPGGHLREVLLYFRLPLSLRLVKWFSCICCLLKTLLKPDVISGTPEYQSLYNNLSNATIGVTNTLLYICQRLDVLLCTQSNLCKIASLLYRCKMKITEDFLSSCDVWRL